MAQSISDKDEEFHFDESLFMNWDLESINQELDLSTPTDNVEVGTALVEKSRKQKPVKSKVTKMGNKNPRTIVAPEVVSPLETVEFKLFVFPSFDRSDAMIYLPCTIARLGNSGDRDQLNKLLRGYCAKDCEVILGKFSTFSLSLMRYIGFMNIAETLFPDSFSCVYSTKVENNEIRAEMYFKYTNNPDMHTYAHSVVGANADPFYNMAFVGERKELLPRHLQLMYQPEPIQEKVSALIELNEEIEVYGKEELTLTFDPYSKKITSIRSANTILSVKHCGLMYNFSD